jgi:hypothetical protein
MSVGEAGRVTRAAKQLHGPDLGREPLRRAQVSGRLSSEQAVVIATAVNRLDPATPSVRIEAAQADLVRYAGELPFDQLQHLANHLVEVVDPDRADELLEAQLRREELAALAGCELAIRVRPDGTSDGRWANLPAVPTAMLRKALDAIAAPRRDRLHVEHGQELDRRVETSPEQLPHANRLGRALAELIEHLPADRLPARGTANATIVVTIDEGRLRDQLGAAMIDTGSAVSASEVRRLACNAGLVPAVLGGDSRVLDLGRSRRLFDQHQRLALALRDSGCSFPRCDRPAAWCEAHHVTPFSADGSTDVSNGALLCSFHHHLIHRGEWQLTIAVDGFPEAIPPPWVDAKQRSIRHSRYPPRPG